MPLTNLLLQLTSFIGREQEMSDIKSLLKRSRLVTLTGMGGSGKTRLAVQTARALNESFAEGVWFVNLAPIHEPALLPQLVAAAFGLRPAADQPPLETLLGFVRSKNLLLILDNCEHLTEACRQLAYDFLSQAPDLRILATSREPLAAAGETIYPVSGLAWPSASRLQEDDPQKVLQYDAVQLFVERAREIAPIFAITPDNARPIVEICRRLDGLPLALELASSWVNILTVQEIAGRIHDRLALQISGQNRDLEPRHRTLRAAIDWSYTLLQADDQALLARLAIFQGGCTLEGIEAVCYCGEIAAAAVLERISSLVRKSLVVAETSGRTQARYRMLETIRAYALEKLEEAGEMSQLSDRHLDFYLLKAEEAAPKLNEAYQQLWLNVLEEEHENLRAALAWSLENGRIEQGLRIATALIRFWEIRGYVQEGLLWYERLLNQADETTSAVVHANALAYASFLAMFLNDAPASLAYGQKAVAVAEAAGDEGREVLAIALAGYASGARVSGDYQTAFRLEERIVALSRETPEQVFFLGMALLALGSVAIELDDFETARTSFDESLAIALEAGDSFRIAHALNALGDLARCEQRYEDAQTSYEKSTALLREIDARHDLASVLQNLGHTYLHLGAVDRGQAFFAESLALHQAQHNVPGIVECLIGYAAAALLRGETAAGARLLGAAAAIGGRRTAAASVWQGTRMEYDHYLNLARDNLSKSEFQFEQTAGRAMTLEQVLVYAQNLPPKTPISSNFKAKADGLTAREREIAALIGQGKTNGEIAGELVVSKRTIETHVSHILSKLELSSRGQIMRWAIDQGLA